VATGSREENAPKQKAGAPALIPSKPERLQQTHGRAALHCGPQIRENQMLNLKSTAAVLALALVLPALSPAQAHSRHHHRHHVFGYYHPHHYRHHYRHHHSYRARYYRNSSDRNEFACTLSRSSQAYEPCMNHW
jgi:hypothetical protein